jgi:hypothetical protein
MNRSHAVALTGAVVSAMMDRELLRVARSVWPFKSEPLQMGVEDGLVWATVRGPVGGESGYVLIPAEGHPWSNGVIDQGWLAPRTLGGTVCYRRPWLGINTGGVERVREFARRIAGLDE